MNEACIVKTYLACFITEDCPMPSGFEPPCKIHLVIDGDKLVLLEYDDGRVLSEFDFPWNRVMAAGSVARVQPITDDPRGR